MKLPPFIAGLALLLCGCATATIHRTSPAPTHPVEPVRKVAVLAVYEGDFQRASVESHFNVQLRAGGQEACVTHDLLTLRAIKADRETAAAKLRAQGADAVLLIRLAGRTSADRDVRATSSNYTPTLTGYETGDWYGGYSVAFTDMSTVWASSQRKVYLDISLYQLNDQKCLWSGETVSTLRDDTDRIEVLSALANKVVAAIRRDGFIR